MPRYFFNVHHGDVLTLDDDGLELLDIAAAEAEAAACLGEMACDVIKARRLAIEVLDENHKLVRRVALSIELNP